MRWAQGGDDGQTAKMHTQGGRLKKGKGERQREGGREREGGLEEKKEDAKIRKKLNTLDTHQYTQTGQVEVNVLKRWRC